MKFECPVCGEAVVVDGKYVCGFSCASDRVVTKCGNVPCGNDFIDHRLRLGNGNSVFVSGSHYLTIATGESLYRYDETECIYKLNEKLLSIMSGELEERVVNDSGSKKNYWRRYGPGRGINW